ncbi:MAG: 2'-5' RNA ligase family protein [Anaerolineaceae bacterium]|nr:2'-5' RNA ligase family protein [Anaerolineaceae bacterium]
MTFYTLASPINIDENSKIHAIWNELDLTCNVNHVKYSPIPHFSWITFKGINNHALLNEKLHQWAGGFDPFQIKVSGLGIFQGEQPIVYLPIVRTSQLSKLHSGLLKHIDQYIEDASSFYFSENWMPHITLAIRDITLENLSCAVGQCMQFDLTFRLNIDHLAILYMDEKSFGIQQTFPFGTT